MEKHSVFFPRTKSSKLFTSPLKCPQNKHLKKLIEQNTPSSSSLKFSLVKTYHFFICHPPWITLIVITRKPRNKKQVSIILLLFSKSSIKAKYYHHEMPQMFSQTPKTFNTSYKNIFKSKLDQRCLLKRNLMKYTCKIQYDTNNQICQSSIQKKN